MAEVAVHAEALGGCRWPPTAFTANSVPQEDCGHTRVKVVDFLLGDEDKMLKVWKVRSLAECKVGTTSHSE